MNEFVIDYLYDLSLRTIKKKFGPKKYSKKMLKNVRDQIAKKINRKNKYMYLSCENEKVTKLLLATTEEDHFYKEVVSVMYYEIDDEKVTKKEIKEDLIAVQKKLGAKLHLTINLSSKKVKTVKAIKALKFDLLGEQLLGSIDDSLRYLKTRCKQPDDIEIRLMNHAKDGAAALKLDKYIHKNTKNNGINMYTPNHEKELAEYLKKLCAGKTSWVLTHKDKVIGHISSASKMGPIPWIFWLGVHPKYQNLGLSNLLYHHMLTAMKKQGHKRYGGFSKSPVVLRKAKKMKRASGGLTFVHKGKIK